jgi:hypothetical protein
MGKVNEYKIWIIFLIKVRYQIPTDRIHHFKRARKQIFCNLKIDQILKIILDSVHQVQDRMKRVELSMEKILQF